VIKAVPKQVLLREIKPEQLCGSDPLARLLLKLSHQNGFLAALIAIGVNSVFIIGGGLWVSFSYTGQKFLPGVVRVPGEKYFSQFFVEQTPDGSVIRSCEDLPSSRKRSENLILIARTHNSGNIYNGSFLGSDSRKG
jgi:hypothetical protein